MLRVIQADERNVSAWYWLGRVVESSAEREICLENVLALDPAHTAVQEELDTLRREMAQAQADPLLSKEAIAAAIPTTAAEQLVSDAAIEPLGCPYCGGLTDPLERLCPGCHRDLYIKERKRKRHSIYSLGMVLVWFVLANFVWLGLVGYYVLSGLSSALEASPGATRTVELLGSLLGMEGANASAPAPPLVPGLLAGGAVFLLSLLVAVGLYRRWPFFYWLSVAVVLSVPFVTIYQMVTAEGGLSVGALITRAVLFLTAIGFSFLAYDEFVWVEHRLVDEVDRDADNPSALYVQGGVYASQGMWAKARTHLSRAVALSPGQPDHRLALASALINLGEPEKAVEHLEVVREIEGDGARARALMERVREMEQE